MFLKMLYCAIHSEAGIALSLILIFERLSIDALIKKSVWLPIV